jgi:pimeloyl-ACP methyl ester carboxylesterase
VSALRLLAASGATAVLVVGFGQAGRSGPAPRERIEGPFGRGASAVWLLRPRTAPRSIIVFAHGWKVSPPSRTKPWVVQFGPWLDHLVAGGSAVLFPRYQLGGDEPGVARVIAFRRGLLEGFSRLGLPDLPVVVAGYSYGASLAFYYAANARRWRLPTPKAVFSVFPAGLIPGAALPQLPGMVRVLLQVGDRDTVAGAAGAQAFWAWLAHHPPSRKRFEIVHSGSALTATHAAPKLDTPGARRAFWDPLDALIAESR